MYNGNREGGSRSGYARGRNSGSNSNSRNRSGSTSRSGSTDSRSGDRKFSGNREGRRPFNSGGSRGGRSFGGNRGGFGGGRGRRSRFSQGPAFVNENNYIKKAEAQVAEVDKAEPDFRYGDLNVNNYLKENIKRKGYDRPTPIQEKSIPVIMEGKDIVGIANTGTGKTAAFLVPLIDKAYNDRKTKVLILAPTRELAEQINNELYSLTKGLNVYSIKCIGGESIFGQLKNFRLPYNFLIGTPGRVQDLMKRSAFNLKDFNTVVLDEVDRMLDMGFVDEIRDLMKLMPEEKHSIFFSATVDRKVEDLIKQIVKPDFVKISVVKGQTSQNVNQDVVRYTDTDDKLAKLKDILAINKNEKVIIFANTKREVDRIDKILYKEGFKLVSIHGDKRQNVRKASLNKFRKGQAKILIATDVAARGLDIPSVNLVINYDLPNNNDDYAHRIGRTGRAENIGHALTFIKGQSPKKVVS